MRDQLIPLFTRRWMLLTVMVCALLGSSCGDPRGVTGDQIDLVAWYLEDVAHGQPRNPQELKVTNPTPEMDRIATWLAGTTVREQHQPPRQLASRRERWPEVKALFVQGHAVVLDDGLIGANPSSSREDQTYALPIVDAENRDRRSLEALLISLAKCDRAEAKIWVARMAAARVKLDTQAGAKRWVGKY
jgi:hypothetical protein